MRPVAFLALTFLTLVVGCRSRGSESSVAVPLSRPNVLLVTIDTLRADHVGSYGYHDASTPTIDALAHRGVRFETAVAHAPLTGPSHASILTGQTPLGHGFRNNSGFILAPEVKTVAQDFRSAGYHTAGFVSGFPLDRRFGFDRGFETYDDRLPKGNDRRRTPYVERFADATTDAVLRWLATVSSQQASQTVPWFMWVHYYDPHAPYEPPVADLADRFRQSPYDGEIAFVDRQLGRLLQTLDATGETSRTIVLVTADHGESLGEHGEGTHGIFLYDATLRVPWIMAGPRIAAGRVSKTIARSIDVLPTLLDYSGLPQRTDVDGRSLRRAADGEEMSDAPAYAESLYSELELGWAPLHAWRTAQFKFIKAPHPELYDLQNDPSEKANRGGEQGPRVSELSSQLEVALRHARPSAPTQSVDAETAERLRALGYVSGRPASRPAGAALRDPKDGVRFLPRLNRGMSAARSEPELAIRELTAVLDEDPGLFMARRTRAVAYAAAGRHELAIADLRLLDKEGQLTAEDAVVLGDNLLSAGRLEEAALILQRAERENPSFPQPLISLAAVRIQERKYDEAAAACEKVLKLAPDHIEALRRLGDLALLRQDLNTAAARYARILEVDAGDVPAMTKLGVVRMRSGRPDEAMRLFREAIDREPGNAEALLYLAGGLASAGRSADALPFFERALKADPTSTMALNGLGLARLDLGDTSGAVAAFRESLRLDPKQADIARMLGEVRQGR
jgi:arylsulfatase A-like enzyme/cytochrome c-type biogenesis protein CcmH/NrfG